MQYTPKGALNLAILLPLCIAVIGILLSSFIPIIFTGNVSLFFILFSLIIAGAVMYPLQTMPEFYANKWRLDASSEMVLCIFYIVTYMRHTSNLENALKFASDHLTGPLALDLKKYCGTSRLKNIQLSLKQLIII